MVSPPDLQPEDAGHRASSMYKQEDCTCAGGGGRRRASGRDEMDKQALIAYVESLQEIQRRNPPTSIAWIRASKEINACAKILAGMK